MSQSSLTYLGATQNVVSSASGSIPPLLGSRIALTGATVNYYPIQSGQVISVGNLTAAGAITLPPVETSSGYSFTVVVNSEAATLHDTLTISGQTACLRGFILQPAAVGVAVQAANSYNSGAAAGTPATRLRLNATCVPGDRVKFECDGVSWFVTGWSGVASATQSMTFLPIPA